MATAQGQVPSQSSAKLNSRLPLLETDVRSTTPIAKVASVAAEVADTAAALDKDDKLESERPNEPDNGTKEDNLQTPLFAHEAFGGAYEFADDRLDHQALDDSDTGRSQSSSKNYTFEDADLNDPTIEKFPSDRGSVITKLRKLQASLGTDQAVVEDSSASPRVFSKKEGNGSGEGGSDFLAPETPTSARKRDSRTSQSSVHRSKSGTSLGCISEEEPKAGSKSTSSKDTGIVKD